MSRVRIGLLVGSILLGKHLAALTLKEAEALALKNHPQVSAAQFTALAANQVTSEVRAGYLPTFFASVTGAGAADNSRLASGNLNNPIIYNRFATGVTVSQLITDFGRTGNLTESSRLRARAQEEVVQETRAQVLLQVDRSYYAVLRAESVLRVAEQTVAARQLIVDQVTALANSKLKSGLDVSFATVNLSEARLLLISAQNQLRAASAELSAALGYQDQQTFQLAEEPLPSPPAPDFSQFIAEAIRTRPELANLRFEREAAVRFAEAEKDLRLPSISALGSAGVIPGHDDHLRGRYAAAALNISIPVFNGHLFSARRAEAELRAQAAEKRVKDLENRVARDVKVAWLNANTAFQRLEVTAQLLDQATQALELAQARYDLGLSSIVELSQAQLNKTSAEIGGASAKYEYQIQRAVLDYQIGALR